MQRSTSEWIERIQSLDRVTGHEEPTKEIGTKLSKNSQRRHEPAITQRSLHNISLIDIIDKKLWGLHDLTRTLPLCCDVLDCIRRWICAWEYGHHCGWECCILETETV
jgi:hypothetical protein